MPTPPRPGRWDLLAAAGALALLAVAYLVVPRPAVQYGAWLGVFSIWMIWFVAYGVRWVYGTEE